MTWVKITGESSHLYFFKSTLGARFSFNRACSVWFEALDLKVSILRLQIHRPLLVTTAGDHLCHMFEILEGWRHGFLRDALKFDDDVMQFFRAIGELGPLLTNQFDCTVEEVSNLFRKKSVNLASNVGGIHCA
jgi:hypothetical protein